MKYDKTFPLKDSHKVSGISWYLSALGKRSFASVNSLQIGHSETNLPRRCAGALPVLKTSCTGGKASTTHPDISLMRDCRLLLRHWLANSSHSLDFIYYLCVGGSKRLPFATRIIRLACSCPEGTSSKIPSNLIVRTA